MALLRTCRCLIPQQPRLQQMLAFSTQEQSSSLQPQAAAAAAAQQDQQAQHSAAEEEWTEVIDEKSGQNYYWNQKTGETTELGEPRPKTRFKDRSWEQTADPGGVFQEGWTREPPGRDYTYFYSAVGTLFGIAVGWAMQYMH